MARNTRFNSYDDEMAGSYDEEPSDPEFMAYGSSPSMADEEYPEEPYPEEPMPLFLSGGDEEPRQRGFGTGGERFLDRAPIGPRVFKGAIAAASAAAIAFAILTVGNPLALFADAKASLPAAAAPATPARRLDADELANLLKRAKGLIAVGDIAPARLLLERAANAQEASAALLLAQTYDPAVLGTQDMRSITPDPAMARDWYQKAARLGSMDARQRLAQMQN